MDPKSVPLVNAEDITALRSLSDHRILFGHQSVGANVLQGLREIVEQVPGVRLRIVGKDGVTFDGQGLLVDVRVGENTKPRSKCESFAALIKEEEFADFDIAMMKFCYVDFSESTDVASVFADYKSLVESLKSERPSLTLVHSTVPLTASPPPWKRFMKSLLGRSDLTEALNGKRSEFNDLLRTHFASEPLFDIAKAESRSLEGARSCSTVNGREVCSLLPEYTDDGGHLNALGRRVVALEFIRSLSGAVRVRPATSP